MKRDAGPVFGLGEYGADLLEAQFAEHPKLEHLPVGLLHGVQGQVDPEGILPLRHRLLDPRLTRRGVLRHVAEAALAALLVGEKPKLSGYTKGELEALVAKLHAIGAKNVVLTGVSFSPDELGSAVSDGSTVQYDFNPKLERMSHGTGDVYASVFAGAILRGRTALEAAALAADVVCEAIKATDDDHWYGVSFERAIPFLARQLA